MSPPEGPALVQQFGLYPFEQFIIKRWDASSTQGNDKQFRSLVGEWIRIGEYGRNEYDRLLDVWDGMVPDHVPQDLTDREFPDAESNIFWVRTWYGNEGSAAEGKEVVSRAEADACYNRLCRVATEGSSVPSDFASLIDLGFDNDPARFGVSQDDVHTSVVTSGEVPAFVETALMDWPHSMHSRNVIADLDTEGIKREEKQLLLEQHILFLVADRKACEEGWVLFVALNHKGQVLPVRPRSKASCTSDQVNQWVVLGNPIYQDVNEGEFSETGEGWGHEEYCQGPGDGWDTS